MGENDTKYLVAQILGLGRENYVKSSLVTHLSSKPSDKNSRPEAFCDDRFCFPLRILVFLWNSFFVLFHFFKSLC